MVTALYALFAAALLLAFVFAARQRSWLVALVCLAVVYDNLVIALGATLGEGDLLKGLNAGRFAAHAVFTPLLIPAAVLLANRHGIRWATLGWARAGAAVLTVLGVGLGVWTEIVEARLEPRWYGGTLRYVDTAAAGPPIPAIVAMLILVVVGATIWRRTGWPWLCLGAVAMFVAAGAGFSIPWLGNLGEVLLLSSLTWTAVRLTRAPDPARAFS